MKMELEFKRDVWASAGTEREKGRNARGHVGAGSERFGRGQVREEMSVAFRFLCKFGTEPKHRHLYKYESIF